MKRRADGRIAIIGAGLGGLAAAALLQKAGYDAKVYEQTPTVTRLGAGIHLGPNVTRILRKIGIEPELRRIGAQPDRWANRAWNTGEMSFDCILGPGAEKRYGSPYLILHRGDFHEILCQAVKPESIGWGKRLVDLDMSGTSVRLTFDDHTHAEADWVIGADGVNSRVREILLGPEAPKYTGYVAHRSIFPASRIDFHIDDCTKWWSPDRHIVVYFLTSDHREIYFVTGVPRPTWPEGVAWLPGDYDELRASFAGFEPRVQALLNASTEMTTWPLLERDPLPLWSRDRVVLLGDACHPMKPHMGQGAAIAIEDAAMLVRCLEHSGSGDLTAMFKLYETNRIERSSRVQHESHTGEWMRHPVDPFWVYGYDVFNEPLKQPVAA